MAQNDDLISRRNALGLSQTSLGEQIRFSQEHISRVESGRLKPSAKYLRALEALEATTPSDDDRKYESMVEGNESYDEFLVMTAKMPALIERFKAHWKRDEIEVIAELGQMLDRLDGDVAKRGRVLRAIDAAVGMSSLGGVEHALPEDLIGMICHFTHLPEPEGALPAAARVLKTWKREHGKWEAVNALLKCWGLHVSDKRVGTTTKTHPLHGEMSKTKSHRQAQEKYCRDL